MRLPKATLDEKLAEIKKRGEESQTQRLAQEKGLSYMDLTVFPIESSSLLLIQKADAIKGNMAVVKKNEADLKIAVTDPDNPETQAVLENLKKKGYACEIFLVSKTSLAKAIEMYKGLEDKETIGGEIDISPQRLEQLQTEIKSIEDVKNRLEKLPADQATVLLEIIIAGSLQNDASDLHIEGKENGCLLRYRVDGLLHDVVSLSAKVYLSILSRIKLLSGMVLNVNDRAQDGRFTIDLETMQIEVRVSVIPGPNGENIVMRILNPKSIQLGLDKLGFRDDAYQFIKKEIARPNGMIITTGPTGSGKTTTLYAFLREVTNPEIKIITLEDPIEYHLAGVQQTQVEADRGYTFADGLRAILRQDPDVILVGEIRDKETAEIAIQSALTGHIVFSTLHTNDAAGAIPRFIDMGVNPTILSGALIDIMAQRLLRRVCPHCKKEYRPSDEEMARIKKALAPLPKEILDTLPKQYLLFKGEGCPQCNGTGYKGRISVYEIINVDREIEKMIAKSPTHVEILEAVQKKGFISMYQDGVIKVVQSITTLEEVENVVGKE